MASSTDSNDVNGKAFHLKATRQLLECREEDKVVLIDIGHCLALGADEVVMNLVIQLNAH